MPGKSILLDIKWNENSYVDTEMRSFSYQGRS